MNLHALRMFTVVAEKGSVTRAAEALMISQPAVTAQLRALERETGVTLLVPDGRGIRLTEAGEWLAGQARRLFAWEKEIEERLADVKAGKIGRLRVAATNVPATLLLPKWLAAFKQACPDVEAELSTGNSQQVYDRLLHFEADLAVVAGGWEQPGVQREVLFEDELWFIVPPGHRFAGREVSLAEMMKEPFLLREEGSSTRERLLALCRTRRIAPPPVAIRFSGMNESIQAVVAGYGAMLASALAVRGHIANQEVARVYVKDVELKRPICVCTREGEELPPVAHRFVAMVMAQYP